MFLSLKILLWQRGGMGYAKEKNGQVSKEIKQWVL
jgi:hypothetical protein